MDNTGAGCGFDYVSGNLDMLQSVCYSFITHLAPFIIQYTASVFNLIY